MTIKEIDQAVIPTGKNNRNAIVLVREAEFTIDAQRVRQRFECAGNIFLGNTKPFQLLPNPRKELSRFEVGMLVGMENISVATTDEFRNPMDQPLVILTAHVKGCRLAHIDLVARDWEQGSQVIVLFSHCGKQPKLSASLTA